MSLFHYITYKCIIIKDKRLGFAYYSLALIILLYTFVQIIINKAYLKFDYSPKGSIRLLVSTPPFNNAAHPSYCDNNLCKRVDGLTLNWPVESKAVTIATFMKEIVQEKKCFTNSINDINFNTHTDYSAISHSSYYPMYPEEALVKIEHSISTSSLFSASHRMMTGVLLGSDGHPLKFLNSNNSSSVDKLYLKDFLKAANISLDRHSDALSSRNRTYRQNGLVLRVTIDYSNAKGWFGKGKTEYTYSVEHNLYSDYRIKQELPIALPNGTICKRVVIKRYAVRIEFVQVGKIGEYSMSNLILQIVSLMGLLTLATTIIDVAALYVVPDKGIYRQYVFDSSPELQTNVRDEKANLLEKKDQ
ncbi:P2X receptor E isoform X1 [Hydra vulgaris]|uniref:P2X receptor E isoform X1 n=1 Tax=Hydra vulgaris TaxID=6087 RepID=UPI0001925F08|nr:P2X receptor E [Hydra vulgaris]